MLGLRLVLLAAHLGYFVLAFKGPHWTGLFWNAIFLVINGYHIVKILRSRRVIRFEPDVEQLYQQVFKDLGRADFLKFWNLGTAHEVHDSVVLAEGDAQKELCLVFKGSVLVEKGGGLLNTLGPGRFFAEMGYLTRQPASATIRVGDDAVLHAWAYDALDSFTHKYPDIWHSMQGVLGRDMARKIAEQNPR